MSLNQVSPGKAVEGEGTIMDLGSIRGARNNRVTINVDGASETYYFDPDTTVVYVVDTRNWGDITLGDFSDLSEAQETPESTTADPKYYNNVLFEYDTELYLTVVYVEAVGRDVEALISYEETASMDIELPTLTLGAELTDLDTDHFTICLLYTSMSEYDIISSDLVCKRNKP